MAKEIYFQILSIYIEIISGRAVSISYTCGIELSDSYNFVHNRLLKRKVYENENASSEIISPNCAAYRFNKIIRVADIFTLENKFLLL